ncbi:MAG: hypothetical protein QGI83_11180, partial [Candidatus Latescibacteria bacterium]|nr:hypothetical protein [Candidatus Latescibacterota bacterium]
VRGLSKFTAREIGEMGFDLIWNAFEGKQSGYGKQKGMPIADLYKGLQSVGCGQLCSMIIGFPYQDEATMKAEFDELMALFPAMFQCLIYFAFPGTPFHAQVIKEDRYRKRYKDSPDLRRWDGFAMHFDHPKFADPSDIERIQKDLYRQDLERLGPSPLRYARVWLDGCINLRNDPNPLLAARAERLGELSRCVLGLVSPSMIPGYPAHQQAQWDQLRRDIIKYTGELSFTDKVVGRVAPGLRRFFDATTRHRLIQQPGLLRTEHRIAGGEATLHTRHVFRLQGGRFSGMGKAVLENVKDRWAERQADPVHPFEPQETTPVTRQCGMLPSVYAGVANPSAPPCHSQHEPETTQPEAREDEVRPPSAVPAL